MNEVLVTAETVEPGIALVKVNRPKALNALNKQVLAELAQAFVRIAKDDLIRVVILSGEGEKAFVAGADISEMIAMTPSEATEFSKIGHDTMRVIEMHPVPVIAMVQGFALGGGAELALACDFIFASDKASFGFPEVGLGVVPGFGGTFRFLRSVGVPRAKDAVYSGRRIEAKEAYDLGIFSRMFPSDLLYEKTLEAAREIASKSPQAVSQAKRLLNEFQDSTDFNYQRDAEAQAFGRMFAGSEQKEGMRAFSEKRKPNWSSKQQ